jgi:hypothetical protein
MPVHSSGVIMLMMPNTAKTAITTDKVTRTNLFVDRPLVILASAVMIECFCRLSSITLMNP